MEFGREETTPSSLPGYLERKAVAGIHDLQGVDVDETYAKVALTRMAGLSGSPVQH